MTRILFLVAGRVVLALVTLLLVSLVVFCALEVIPGDVATRILGRHATPESLAAVREQLGLHRPAVVRYFSWLQGVAVGDFGHSLISGRPVSEALATPLRNTLILSACALLLYFPIAFGIAVVQALNRERPVDFALSTGTLLMASIPDFLLGTILLLLFAVFLPVLPVLSQVTDESSLTDWLRAVAMPAATLAVVMAVYAIRMLRDNLIDALNAEHVHMAALRGLGRRAVVIKYALPTALIPTVNVTALNISYLVGGVVIVEKVFTYPGFGSVTIDAFQLRDLPMIEATVLIAAAIYIVANLIADILAILLNPKLRDA